MLHMKMVQSIINVQDNAKDMADDIVHEIAHSLEELQ